MRFLLCLTCVTLVCADTDVRLDRTQLEIILSEIKAISHQIVIEEGNITLDTLRIETLMERQNALIGNVISSLNDVVSAVKEGTHKTEGFMNQESEFHNSWFQKFEQVMTPINQILQDVNGAISLVQTTVNAINTVFLAFQTTQDAGIADISSAVDTIAAEFVLGMKGVVAEAMLGSSLTFGAIECTAWEGDGCVSIVGEGPIVCAGMEAEFCEIEGIVLEPIPIDEQRVHSRRSVLRRVASEGAALKQPDITES